MLALRDEATSWQPFVRPDPWLSPIGRLSLGIPGRISSKCHHKQVRLVKRSDE